MKFHPATLSDAARLSSVGKRSYHHHFARLWHSPEEMDEFVQRQFSVESIIASLTKPDSGWFWIEVAGEAVGLCQVNWALSVAENRPDGAYLNKIYILPEHTGKGYGSEVFAQVEAFCRQKKKAYYWLEVLKDNPGATQFYQRQGFTLLREELFASPSQQSVIYVMTKSLAETTSTAAV